MRTLPFQWPPSLLYPGSYMGRLVELSQAVFSHVASRAPRSCIVWQEGSVQRLPCALCRAWRAQAKEWLALLASLKGLRGLYGAAAVRSTAAQQILDGDPSLQQAALLCLKVPPLEDNVTQMVTLSISPWVSWLFCGRIRISV